MLIEIELEIAKTERECYQRAVIRVMAGQNGEAWLGLDDRRNDTPPHMRGLDRRSEHV